MTEVPGGPDGRPEPQGAFVQGKPQPVGKPPEANWRLYARIFVWAVLAVIALLFVVRNRQSVPINFVFFEVTAPLFVALLVALLLGMLLGGTGAWWSARRKRKEAVLEAKARERD